MKYNTNKKIFIALLIILAASETEILAAQSGVFPKDPRAHLLPIDARPSTSANINFNAGQPQLTQDFLPGSENFSDLRDSSKNNLAVNNENLLKKNFALIVLWTPIIFIVVILFSALIFTALRSFNNESEN